MSDLFVGRDGELAALTRALDRAVGGEATLALVAGEPGIGKSRLVDALAGVARGRGARLVWGEAREGQRAPLSLWAPVERALGAATDGRGHELPPSERRWELIDLLVAELAELAERAPVVVVLEDLHWADEASVWVLDRLPRRLAGHAVLLVATARRDEPGSVPLTGVRRQAGTVVELAGLDVAAAERLVDALTVTAPVDAADLVERTGGNPLFLRELLAIGSRGDRLPPAVSDVLARSLAHLDEPVREALATLAVAGPATPVAVLTAALGSTVDEVMDRFEVAAAADVVELGPAGRPRFRHVLLSAAAVEALSPTQRRRRHAALADAWTVIDKTPTGLAQAAAHRLAALPHGDAATAADHALAALEALRTAGDAGAAAELAAAADRALDAVPAPEVMGRRARVVVERARAITALGDEVAAGEVFARAADLLVEAGNEGADGDPGHAELRALAEAGACRRANPFLPDPDRIRRLAEADAALPPGDQPRRVDILGRMAVLRCAVAGSIPVAHAEGDEAVAMARRLGDPDLLVQALTDRHYIAADLDGLHQRAAAADEMVALGERLRRPDVALQGYEWRFGERLDRGERNAAAAALDALEAYGLVMPSPKWRWSAVLRRGTMHALDGDRAGLLACADEVSRLGDDVAEQPEILGMEGALRATASQLWGVNDDRVEDVCDRFAAVSRPFQAVPFISLVLARAWCAIGRLDQARPIVARHAADPEPLFDILEGIAVVARLGGMVAELGLAEHAGRLRRLLLPYGDRLGTGAGLQLYTPVATTLGRLALLQGDAATAVADHERAVAIAEAMPSPTLVALTHAFLAEARAAAGDAAGARAAMERARWASPAGMVLPHVGIAPEQASSPTPTSTSTTGGHGGRAATLRRVDADTWAVESPHGRATLPASRGVDQLARLLAAPAGTEVPCTELAGMDAAPVPVARDLGAALDARAKREYRRRITELQDDIDEAEAHHDPERAARARLELDALVQELRRAVGLDGRDRPTGSGAERARVNVTRSLKRAVAGIADQLPVLGAHLERSVRTGRHCSYSPEPSTALTWEITP